MTDEHATLQPPPSRNSGILLAIGSAIAVVFIALHPNPHAHDPSEAGAAMEHIATLNAIVHGALIANQSLILLGLIGLAGRLGFELLSVRGGLVAYAFGVLGVTGAALTNGFIVPALIAHHVD